MRDEDARAVLGVTPARTSASRPIRLFDPYARLLFGFSPAEAAWRRAQAD